MKEKPFTPSELLQRIKKQVSRSVSYPSIEEQKAYWEERDKGLDKIESCSAWFEELDRKQPF